MKNEGITSIESEPHSPFAAFFAPSFAADSKSAIFSAFGRKALPASVSDSRHLFALSKRRQPTSLSSDIICLLKTDCPIPSLSAAREKWRVSAAAIKHFIWVESIVFLLSLLVPCAISILI